MPRGRKRYIELTCKVYNEVLVLGASNIRLVIENWMKYGLLIRLPHSYIPYQDYGLFVLAWLSVPICLCITFFIELGLGQLAMQARGAKNPSSMKHKVTIFNTVAGVAHVFHLVFLITYPSYIVYEKIYHPLGKSHWILEKRKVTHMERESSHMEFCS